MSFAVAACAAPQPEPPPVPVVVPLDAEAPFDDRLPPPEPAVEHAPAPWKFDVLHYGVRVTPDFEQQAIEGTVRIAFAPLEHAPAEIPLDAVGLEVASAHDAAGRPLPWRHDGRTLHVEYPATATGARQEIEVRYRGRPLRGIYFNLPGPHEPAAPRQVYTQGECIDTRHWLPCHDAPDDFATHDIKVTVPSDMMVMAAGAPRGVEIAGGGRRTWSFATDVPHVVYLVTFVAGDYVLQSDATGPVPLEFMAEARDAPHVRANFARTADVLRFFGELTGRPYPHAKYAQVCVRDFMYGGMENVSAATLTDHTVHPADWEPARPSTGLVAHEAAHQWFGDLLTCADWSDCWLNEGFATYLDLLFTEHDLGRDEFLVDLRGARHGALGAMDSERRSVVTSRWADPFDLFDGHAYAGGAVRLHMLRRQLGDERWVRALRHYVKTREGTPVRTADLRRAVAEATGEDLGAWFDQWLHRPGYPILAVRWKWDEARASMVVTVDQRHEAKDGAPAAYRLPLDVAFDLRNGTSVTERLDLTERRHEFVVALPGVPRFVRPDPDSVLLARWDLDRPIDEWAALLRVDPNPSGRLDAADALAAIARDDKRPEPDRVRAHDALLAAFPHERVVAVRAAMAGGIASRKVEPAARALAAAAGEDEDLRVRLAALDALGQFDGDAVARETFASLAGHPHDLVRAAAVSGLARVHHPEAPALLRAALDRPGWHSSVRSAALRGFADFGDETAFALLVHHARPGVDPWARPSAIESLGRLGKKRPEYRDALLPYLQDPQRGIRQKAAEAFGALLDPDAIPVLVTAFHRETWPGVRDALRKAVEGCRKQAVDENRLVTLEAVREAEARKAKH